jgi:hypothetical protein
MSSGEVTPPSSAAILPFQPKPNQPESYLKLRHAFLRSAAWQSLPAIVRAVYVDLASKHNGRNNGHIVYSTRDCAKRLRISKDTAARALRLLAWRDLIRCTSRGSFKVKTQNAKAPEWLLTDFPESLVSPEGPAGLTGGPSNGFPDLTRGTHRRIREESRRGEDFRGSEVFRGRPKDKTERLSREEWVALERLASLPKPNGGAR